MNYDKYTGYLLRQFKGAADVYAGKIFETVETLTEVQGFRTEEHLRIPPTDGLTEIRAGEKWGGLWQNLWLSFNLHLDERYLGRQVWLIADAEAVEILCFRNGEPAGIINSKNRFIGGEHSAFFVTRCDSVCDFQIDLECYAGHYCPGGSPFANYGRDTGKNEDFIRVFNGIRVCVMDEAINDMVFDLSTVLEMAELPENNFLRGKAIRALRDAFPCYIQDSIAYSREELDEATRKVSEKLAPALEKSAHPEGDGSRGHVHLIGHSHMDTAWLWPYSETIRKCARTYSQALSLMDRYPNYQFIQSSALHLSWMETYYPSIFEGIKKRTAEGRYEPNGGVWVECDCNVTGGEAMVRQFLYGQRYTREKMGYTSDCFWLPDTFGYNAAIPQIMLQSDVKYFLTTKIAWNDLNGIDSDTFRWQGLDGSEVLTHFNIMHTMPDVTNVQRAVDEIHDKSTSDSRLLAYGYGDGGGGPTYGMLEFLKRTQDLPGLPSMEQTTVSRYMQEQDAKREQFPVLNGELYLELHRGTLTSIHDIKRNNRRAETALHNLEFLNAASGRPMDGRTEYLYKELLRNQFHDILPGSSIAEVNATSRKEMAAMLTETAERTAAYLGTPSGTLSFVNSSPADWTETDVLEAEGTFSPAGLPSQRFTDVMGRECTALSGLKIAAYSAVQATEGIPAGEAIPFKAEGNHLTTPLYEAEFDECGYISSLVDRETGREYVNRKGEPLGTFWMAENVPYDYENWEISPSVEMKYSPVRSLLSREIVSIGSVELRIRTVYALSRKSTAAVDTVFHAANRQIDYQVRIDWHDRCQLLKAGFDLNVKSDSVRNEIQFGHVLRPTGRNNSLETARFEVVNHKWSDLSDSRTGVALLNDCKYGMSAKGSELRLTLMHGGTRPDYHADEGVHEMRYALLPHTGPFTAPAVISPAYRLNNPVSVQRTDLALDPLVCLSSDHVYCETVKCAEDGKNAFVLRLYEAEGVPADCEVTLGTPFSSVEIVNMLEEKQSDALLRDGKVALQLRPFEIVTLLVNR